VLAAGMFGAAAGEAAAVRTRYEAALRTEAAQLALTLAERMRANRAVLAAYLPLELVASGDSAPAGPECTDTCSAQELAAADIAQVAHVLGERFPGGRLVVCRDEQSWDTAQDDYAWPCVARPGSPIVVKLGWRERGAASARGPRIVLPLGEP